MQDNGYSGKSCMLQLLHGETFIKKQLGNKTPMS